MWVFDGEQWHEEGKSSNVETPNSGTRPEVPYEMFLPELEVREVPLRREEERWIPIPRI